MKNSNIFLFVVGTLLIGYGLSGSTLKNIIIVKPNKPSEITSVVYVYEKDDGPIPQEIHIAIEKLNKEKNILASLFEKDIVDGNGQTPFQYKQALEAAKIKGVPSLVVLSGSNIVTVLKNPKTEKEVLEAIP